MLGELKVNDIVSDEARNITCNFVLLIEYDSTFWQLFPFQLTFPPLKFGNSPVSNPSCVALLCNPLTNWSCTLYSVVH